MTASTKRHIVDAHHHLWDLGACDYPWLMAKGVTRFFGDPTPIQKNYLVEHLRDDSREYELDASVHIQVGVAAGHELGETEWLQATADEHGLPTAIVAACELDKPDAIDNLKQQQTYANVRGVRQIVGRSQEEDAVTGSGGLIDNVLWRENLAELGRLGLSFDLQMIPQQAAAIGDLLATVPQTQIAICHCGSPWDQSPAGFASWRDGMRLLASLPNVVCKISGLGMFDHNWTTQSIRPIVETCIELFGADRTMFGSNFPVDKLHASYTRVWSAFEEITAGMSSVEQAGLFAANARSFYRID